MSLIYSAYLLVSILCRLWTRTSLLLHLMSILMVVYPLILAEPMLVLYGKYSSASEKQCIVVLRDVHVASACFFPTMSRLHTPLFLSDLSFSLFLVLGPYPSCSLHSLSVPSIERGEPSAVLGLEFPLGISVFGDPGILRTLVGDTTRWISLGLRWTKLELHVIAPRS